MIRMRFGEELMRLLSLLGGVLLLIAFEKFYIVGVDGQRSVIDDTFMPLYRPIRVMVLNAIRAFAGSNNNHYLQQHQRLQNADGDYEKNVKFCNTKDGVGVRSSSPPNSVHRLRPGDIDIIGAMGDSLTAGNAILDSHLVDILRENRGSSWSIGGDGDWRQYFTLPNILKEFNPNLYGYSLADGLSTDRTSKFNVAELGAFSYDMPYMATVLVKRMKHDRNVNMTHHWKLITLMIGGNDLCSDICYHRPPMESVDRHEEHLLKAIRYLRDNVPRLMVNLVPAPNVTTLTTHQGSSLLCQRTLTFECPCLVGRSKAHIQRMNEVIKKWIERDEVIANRDEFNTDTFTVNFQPFIKGFKSVTHPNGTLNTSFTSSDCFHLTQRLHARATMQYWNNMLQLVGEKKQFHPGLADMLCPTVEMPYLVTRSNSGINFANS